MKKSRKFGLIGKNIDYSFSKKYFSEKFKKENLDCTYSNFDVVNISEIESILQNNSISGYNVTIPYKEEIINFLDEIDEVAKDIGAVNTIKKINNKNIGFNTDSIGFEKSLLPLIENKIPKNALILGSGGASKAIKYVLKKLKINYSTVSRKEGKSEFVYENLNEVILNKFKMIINCSPVGTFPNINNCPNIPYKFLTKDHILYDLVYNPIESLFLKRGRNLGCKTKNGLEMLEIQANESWSVWNN
jgi:shikimate dehydrogenase